jgi:hypothetical protein
MYAGAGLSFPQGHFHDLYTNGANLALGLGIAPTDRLAILAMAELHPLGRKFGTGLSEPQLPTDTELWLLGPGLRYTLIGPGSTLRPYLLAQGGWALFRFDLPNRPESDHFWAGLGFGAHMPDVVFAPWGHLRWSHVDVAGGLDMVTLTLGARLF